MKNKDCPICGRALSEDETDSESHVMSCLQKATAGGHHLLPSSGVQTTANESSGGDPWQFLRNSGEAQKRISSTSPSSSSSNKKQKLLSSTSAFAFGRQKPPVKNPACSAKGTSTNYTTLARIIADKCKTFNKRFRFVKLSATTSNLGELKKFVEIAKNEKSLRGLKTIIFMDEIHRFNKLQQDSFLPHVEDGSIILIGATTENPSFSLNSALLSRCQVLVFNKLSTENIRALLDRTLCELKLKSPGGEKCCSKLEQWILVQDDSVEFICDMCDGDARTAINALQMALLSVLHEMDTSNVTPVGNDDRIWQKKVVTVETVKGAMQKNHILYDRAGDQHYDIISALHKSVRGSDENATLYWLARDDPQITMLQSGEDPRYVARRLMRMASEDIGLADPNALVQTVAAAQAAQLVGMPECDVMLAQAAVYLAQAPKSIEVYTAYSKAKETIRNHKGPQPAVPLHLRNAPTSLMKNLGYGKDYKYPPSFDEPVEQDYLPAELLGLNFFKK